MVIKSKAYAMIYALFLLLFLSSVSGFVLRYFGNDIDGASNFYGSFQNELYAKSLYHIAKSCLKTFTFTQCQNDVVDFENFKGAYWLIEEESFYRIQLVVWHTNPRNLHIIRYFVEKEIKK